MSLRNLFLHDNRPGKLELLEALDKQGEKDDLTALDLAVDLALPKIRGITPYKVREHLHKLAFANNTMRAKKLVEVISDFSPRLWWVIPATILLWPFIFVIRIIKMGLPK